MARGFESKSVADQQEAAQQLKAPPRDEATEPDTAMVLKRRRLELAKIDVLRQLDNAKAEPHKEMLRRALAALEEDLAKLP